MLTNILNTYWHIESAKGFRLTQSGPEQYPTLFALNSKGYYCRLNVEFWQQCSNLFSSKTLKKRHSQIFQKLWLCGHRIKELANGCRKLSASHVGFIVTFAMACLIKLTESVHYNNRCYEAAKKCLTFNEYNFGVHRKIKITVKRRD